MLKQGILNKLRHVFGLTKITPPKEMIMPNIELPYMDGVLGWYNKTMQMSRDRRSIYYDMEQIGDFVLGSSALEMYTEDAFPFNHDRGATIWISSSNQKVIRILDELNRRIEIETLIPAITYTTAQYGDDFQYLLLSEKGIESVRQIPPYMLTRIEDHYGRLLGYTPGIVDYVPGRDSNIPTPLSRPWDILHTRLFSSYTRVTGHGTSMLMPVRYIWRQLKIMMDAMVLYRWTRGPDRMVYYIDVGTAPPEQQMRILNQWKLYIKKRQHFNPETRSFDQEWNPESIDEDIFFPTSKNSQSKIERLAGASNVSDIADVQLYVNLFFAGLRIPKAFMGFEGEIMAREVLPYQSIRYANVAYKLQRSVLASLVRMYQIHLAVLGYDVRDPNNSFKVHTSTISHLYDVAKSELLQAKMEIMRSLLEFGDNVQLNRENWLQYILRTYLDMDNNVIQSLMHDRDNEGQMPSNGTRHAIDQAVQASPEAMEKLKTLQKMAPFFNPFADSKNNSDDYDTLVNMRESDNEQFQERIRELIEKRNQKEKEKNGNHRNNKCQDNTPDY